MTKVYKIQLPHNLFALIDQCDYKLVSQFKWHITKKKGERTGYARYQTSRKLGPQKGILMHRLILGITDPKIQVDHKDGNGLNNQRSNLRIATHAENMFNRSSSKNSTSSYLGVSWNTANRRWLAAIKRNGITTHLGSFKDEKLAALAYNKASLEMTGEFARLNKVDEAPISQ